MIFFFLFQKLNLDIQMGEHIIDHHAEKTKDGMQNLEEILYHLTDQAILITRHQVYQRVNMNLFEMSVNITNRGTINAKEHVPEVLSTQLTHVCCVQHFFFLGERGEIPTGQRGRQP